MEAVLRLCVADFCGVKEGAISCQDKCICVSSIVKMLQLRNIFSPLPILGIPVADEQQNTQSRWSEQSFFRRFSRRYFVYTYIQEVLKW
jgi:hypothetical protein